MAQAKSGNRRADPPEKRTLTLGYIPLTDCAPLVIAREQGFFRSHGLDVTLSREASWANIRDKVAIGALDGAQMLASMPLASNLGVETWGKPTITACCLDLNGNAITVSHSLYRRMQEMDASALQEQPVSARALKAVIDEDKRLGRRPLTFAHVFPASTHNYALRYWMASAGIHPDHDVRLIVIPPPQMAVNLEAGTIDGYCVGEPWNAYAVHRDIGRTLITGYEIWNNAAEKVFGVNREWAELYPNTHKALIKALIEAGRWLDDPAHREDAAHLLSGAEYLNVPEEVARASMSGRYSYAHDSEARSLPDFHVFSRYAANFPWQSQAQWYILQMLRWGQIERALSIRQAAAQVYRADIYRAAAAELGIDYPTVDEKPEGLNRSEWMLHQATAPMLMGSDCFFDGAQFDPTRPVDYLADCRVHSLCVDLAELRMLNT